MAEGATASAEATVLDYYEALRRGEPLYPYFAERPDVVKVGVGERLVGYEAVAEGLREQTRTTDDWTVESEALGVTASERFGWFDDRVRLAWTDTEGDRRREFGTRWSGTLVRRRAVERLRTPDDGDREGVGEFVEEAGAPGHDDDDRTADEWLFVGMHVSAPHGA